MRTKLAIKLKSKQSWKSWEETQKLRKEPAHKNRLQAEARSQVKLMPELYLHGTGAFFPVKEFTEKILSQAFDRGLFRLAPKGQEQPTIWIKFAWDGTEQKYASSVVQGIKGKAVALSLTIMNVDKSQSKYNANAVGFYIGEESSPDMERFFTNVRLDDFLGDLEDGEWLFVRDGRHVPVEYFVMADWPGLAKELYLEDPGTAVLDAPVCFACGATKDLLGCGKTHDGTWWKEPFKRHVTKTTISVFPHESVRSRCRLRDLTQSQVPIEKRFYCWLHGIARLLTHILFCLYKLLLSAHEQDTYVSTIHQVAPYWQPEGKHCTINGEEMKRFFGERPGGVCMPSTDLLQAFHRPSDPINVEAPDRSVTSLSQAVCGDAP